MIERTDVKNEEDKSGYVSSYLFIASETSDNKGLVRDFYKETYSHHQECGFHYCKDSSLTHCEGFMIYRAITDIFSKDFLCSRTVQSTIDSYDYRNFPLSKALLKALLDMKNPSEYATLRAYVTGKGQLQLKGMGSYSCKIVYHYSIYINLLSRVGVVKKV